MTNYTLVDDVKGNIVIEKNYASVDRVAIRTCRWIIYPNVSASSAFALRTKKCSWLDQSTRLQPLQKKGWPLQTLLFVMNRHTQEIVLARSTMNYQHLRCWHNILGKDVFNNLNDDWVICNNPETGWSIVNDVMEEPVVATDTQPMVAVPRNADAFMETVINGQLYRAACGLKPIDTAYAVRVFSGYDKLDPEKLPKHWVYQQDNVSANLDEMLKAFAVLSQTPLYTVGAVYPAQVCVRNKVSTVIYGVTGEAMQLDTNGDPLSYRLSCRDQYIDFVMGDDAMMLWLLNRKQTTFQELIMHRNDYMVPARHALRNSTVDPRDYRKSPRDEQVGYRRSDVLRDQTRVGRGVAGL